MGIKWNIYFDVFASYLFPIGARLVYYSEEYAINLKTDILHNQYLTHKNKHSIYHSNVIKHYSIFRISILYTYIYVKTISLVIYIF